MYSAVRGETVEWAIACHQMILKRHEIHEMAVVEVVVEERKRKGRG
jgi:hypothetical protein